MIEISGHAYEQAKDRLSWGHDTVDRMAERAWVSGCTLGDTRGRLRAYIARKADEYVGVSHYRIYGEYLYIFGESPGSVTLITVYHIPHEYVGLIPKR